MAYLVFPPEFVPEVSTIVNWVMSFTPLLSYGSTVFSIRRRRSSKGFAIDICSTMLMSATFRIFYYFNDPFEISLLRQCFVMIFIQVILLYNALKFRPQESIKLEQYDGHWEDLRDDFIHVNSTELRSDIDEYCRDRSDGRIIFRRIILGVFRVFFNNWRRNSMLLGIFFLKLIGGVLRLFDGHYVRPFFFWQWKDARKYWYFLVFLVASLSILQYYFHKKEHFGIILGSASFIIESSLPLPQIMLFKRIQTVQNFKTILLLSWLAGDLTKISYLLYGTNNIGMIFIVAAVFQMSLNLVITYLFFKYKRMDIKREQGILPMVIPKGESGLENLNDIALRDLESSGMESSSNDRLPIRRTSSPLPNRRFSQESVQHFSMSPLRTSGPIFESFRAVSVPAPLHFTDSSRHQVPEPVAKIRSRSSTIDKHRTVSTSRRSFTSGTDDVTDV
mgnify:CR=1 FL=1